MNIKYRFKEYEYDLKELEKKREQLLQEFDEAKKNTNIFLQECEKYGIKRVSIATKTNKIKSTKGWSGCYNMIFADEEYDGWPAIWKVASMDGDKYNGGCGNSGQHQFNCATFIEGVYEFKDGKWKLLEGENND